MSRKLILITAALAALVVATAPWVKSQQPGILAVEGATLIDGTGAGPVSNSTIVIENGKITAVGPHNKVKVPAGARVIDAKGKYIIPGLIDSHVHFSSWMGEMFLNNGVTTVFDFGNAPDFILGVKEAERTGKVKNIPHFFVVGAPITRPGGNDSPSFGANAGTPAAPAPPGTPMGPEWARNAAKAMIARGVDAIKVVADNLSGEEIAAITDEAHKSNLKVIGHVDDVYKYVGNGFDGVVHLWGLSSTLMTDENNKRWKAGEIMNPYAYMEPSKVDPLIKFMIEHHASLMPMLIAEHSGVTAEAPMFEAEVAKMYIDPALQYVPMNAVTTDLAIFRRDRSYSQTIGGFPYVTLLDQAHQDEAKLGYKNSLDFTTRFMKAGGRVWLGTDTPGAATVPGMSIRQEVEVLVDGGFTPMQAIQAATKNSAEMFNKGDQVGTLQVGRFGDLLILDGNPLSDIKNIDKIHTVIKAGDVLDGRFHPDFHPSFWRDQDNDYRGTSTNAAPMLTSVTKDPSGSHGDGLSIIAKGRNFYDVSVVILNGRPLATTFVNIGELHATVPANQMPASGPYNVTVRTGWPAGGTSEVKPLVVD